MKRLSVIMAGLLFAGAALTFSACENKSEEENSSSTPVILRAIEGSEVGAFSDLDYYLAPEPAASLKVKKIDSLQFAGNLQSLYGEGKGYPQAVIVGKTSLISDNPLYVSHLLKCLSSDTENLKNLDANEVLSAISSHLTVGLTPTFSAATLTSEVIEHSSVRFTYTSEAKEETIELLRGFVSFSETSAAIPSDEFFNTNFSLKSESKEESLPVKIYAPDGAPALSLAPLMLRGGNEQVEIVDASTIAAYVSGENPKADFCVLPVNLAAKLLGKGNTYQMLGVVTHGNLFFLSANGSPALSKENLSLLQGKKVGVVNLKNVPGLTLKCVLKANGIEFEEE